MSKPNAPKLNRNKLAGSAIAVAKPSSRKGMSVPPRPVSTGLAKLAKFAFCDREVIPFWVKSTGPPTTGTKNGQVEETSAMAPMSYCCPVCSVKIKSADRRHVSTPTGSAPKASGVLTKSRVSAGWENITKRRDPAAFRWFRTEMLVINVFWATEKMNVPGALPASRMVRLFSLPELSKMRTAFARPAAPNSRTDKATAERKYFREGNSGFMGASDRKEELKLAPPSLFKTSFAFFKCGKKAQNNVNWRKNAQNMPFTGKKTSTKSRY